MRGCTWTMFDRQSSHRCDWLTDWLANWLSDWLCSRGNLLYAAHLHLSRGDFPRTLPTPSPSNTATGNALLPNVGSSHPLDNVLACTDGANPCSSATIRPAGSVPSKLTGAVAATWRILIPAGLRHVTESILHAPSHEGLNECLCLRQDSSSKET